MMMSVRGRRRSRRVGFAKKFVMTGGYLIDAVTDTSEGLVGSWLRTAFEAIIAAARIVSIRTCFMPGAPS
jgi:hypothetical protein